MKYFARGWWRLANVSDARRFDEPTVVGVDFPTVVPTQAWWDRDESKLVVSLAPRGEIDVGRATSFKVTNLPRSVAWTATPKNGAPVTASTVDGDVEVRTTVGHQTLVVHARP